MPKAKNLGAELSGRPADTEASFYEALQACDLDKLMACWAEEDEVTCVHPAGPRLVGLGAIRTAFEALFANGSIPVFPERVHVVESLTSAVHSVLERIDVETPQGAQHAYVIATNVYHKTPQGWRLVAHHASPASMADLQDAPPSALLH